MRRGIYKLWNIDVSEMHCQIVGKLVCYADGCGLWFEITDANRATIIETVNTDLRELRTPLGD